MVIDYLDLTLHYSLASTSCRALKKSIRFLLLPSYCGIDFSSPDRTIMGQKIVQKNNLGF